MEKDDDDEHHQPLHSHPMSYPQLKHRGWVPNLLRHMFQGTEGEDGVRQPWSDPRGTPPANGWWKNMEKLAGYTINGYF